MEDDRAWRLVARDPVHGFAVAIRPATPLRLHAPPAYRADCNCPILIEPSGTTAFFAHFVPVGHSYRRTGPSLTGLGPPTPVRLLEDSAPGLGKWIESVWRAPDGMLFGWYHAEAVAPCPDRLMTCHIGALASTDEGRSWRLLGDVLRSDPDAIDCRFRNGWMAGGYGDFSVIADEASGHFYIHFTSYDPRDDHQGIVAARYPIAARMRPAETVEMWTRRGWMPAAHALPEPVAAPRRGWRHLDADAAWGPSVHWNTAIGAYVMLMNRTRGGHGDLVQAAVEIAFNRDLARPSGWTVPVPVVTGGIWYPEVAGTEPGEGNVRVGGIGRFFLSGFSAWEMSFETSDRGGQPAPYPIPETEIARIFGPRRPDGGFGPV